MRRRVYHTFAVRRNPGARWGGSTPVRVSAGHAMVVEPDPAEREELRRRARKRDQIRALNPKPTFRFSIPWGQEFTVFNPGGPARGVTVELVGRDARGTAVQWLLLRAELLDKGYTQVRQNPVEDPEVGRVFQLVGFAEKPDDLRRPRRRGRGRAGRSLTPGNDRHSAGRRRVGPNVVRKFL